MEFIPPFLRARSNGTRVAFVLVSVLTTSISGLGQQASNAILVGAISDPSSASIEGATLTLAHRETGSVTVLKTNSRGQFRSQPLRLGEYNIEIEATGFKKVSQKGVILNIGDVRELNVVLPIGQVTESVTLTEEAPLLQTADSTVGTVITNRQIVALPLNGRDYLQLAALSSGTLPSGQGVSIGGQSGTQAAFFLDGQDNNNQQISTGHSGQKEVIKPSVDAVQEFKVVTNSYSAEYGRSSSGVVAVQIKSGTNQIHGTAYEFLRNEALDAKNFFANQKTPFRRNQFGAAAGGPIKRDRTFVFGDFEVGRIRETRPVTSTLPTDPQRAGQFGSTTIRNPFSGTTPFAVFPGNQIPASLFDPIALKAAAFLPSPQRPSATQNYVFTAPDFSDQHRWDIRLDHVISSSQNAYFRYSAQSTLDKVSSNLPPDPQQGYYQGNGAETSDNRSFVLVHNKVWSGNTITSVTGGWNNIYWENILPEQPLRGLGIPGVAEVNPGFSQLAITGYPTLGVSNIPNTDGSQNRQLSGTLTTQKGAHSLKFGVQAYWLQINFRSSQRSSGIFNFNGQYSGQPFADFLLGAASATNLSREAFLQFRAPYTHFFAQDDWRVNKRLTINVGLRYELNLPAVEKRDRIANFDIDSDPSSPSLFRPEDGDGSRSARALQGTSYNQWAPRFGFAYRLPGDKTVLRGGYGIFFSNMITIGGMQSLAINPPNHVRVNFSTDRAVAPTLLLRNGFGPDALSVTNAQNVTLISYDRDSAQPTAQQWNFNIQRELPGGFLWEVGYFANKFDHNWRRIDGNPAPPGPGNINSRRRYTRTLVPGTTSRITLADVTRVQKDGYSRYHAFQTRLEKRYANGLTLLTSYQFSKSIALGDLNGVQNPLDWRSERAVSSHHRPHYFVSSAVYDLPFGNGKRFGGQWGGPLQALLGGWSVAPIFSYAAGSPLNLSVNGNPSNTGQTDRPNVVGEWRLENPTVERWFNTAAFAANAPFTYGNAGRNILVGPSRINFDAAAHKTFRLTERFTLQFRIESFNATNTPFFGSPNTQVGNQNFGVITSAGTQRNNQLGLKFLF